MPVFEVEKERTSMVAGRRSVIIDGHFSIWNEQLGANRRHVCQHSITWAVFAEVVPMFGSRNYEGPVDCGRGFEVAIGGPEARVAQLGSSGPGDEESN
jgi:hypothetical protein